MLTAGLADTATLAFIAPAHNQLAHAAAATYYRQLTDPAAGPIPFIPLTLEHAFTALATAGLPDQARALHSRYTDWWLLDGELELAMTATTAQAPMPNIATVPPAQIDATFVANLATRKRWQRARSATRTRAAA